MRQGLRPDGAPRWAFVLWLALAGLVLGAIFGFVKFSSWTSFATETLGSVVALGGLTAIIVGVSHRSRLIIDGTDVIHRQVGRTQVARDVGVGWRLITYRSGSGRSQVFIRALFDRDDKPRIILNGSMWSLLLLVRALHPLGVRIMDEHEAVRPSTIDTIPMEQIAALSDEEAARLMKDTEDTTVPPMPRRVTRR